MKNPITLYYRSSDDTSYILYNDNGKRMLTNGVCIWYTSLDEKIATLNKNDPRTSVANVRDNLKKHYPYVYIKGLETMRTA